MGIAGGSLQPASPFPRERKKEIRMSFNIRISMANLVNYDT